MVVNWLGSLFCCPGHSVKTQTLGRSEGKTFSLESFRELQSSIHIRGALVRGEGLTAKTNKEGKALWLTRGETPMATKLSQAWRTRYAPASSSGPTMDGSPASILKEKKSFFFFFFPLWLISL